MAYTDKELKDATQVAYLNLIEDTVPNFIADGKKGPYTLRDLIMANINIESVKKNLKYEDKNINVKDMTIQELIEYAEVKEHDREIIRKLPDEAFEWKISDVHNKNNQNGFYGCVIETSEDNAIVAFRGSEGLKDYPGLINDWCKADFGLLKKDCTDQQKECEHFLEMLSVNGVLDKYKSLSVTGHSLGGNLASHFAIAAATGKNNKDIFSKIEQVVNFDGPGVSNEYLKKYNDAIKLASNKIVHYMWSPIGAALNSIPGEEVNYLQIDEKQHKKDIGDQIWYKTFYRHHTDSIMFSKTGRAIRGDQDEFSKVIHGLSVGVDIAPTKLLADILIPNSIQSVIGTIGSSLNNLIYHKKNGEIGINLFGKKADEWKEDESPLFSGMIKKASEEANRIIEESEVGKDREDGKDGHKDVEDAAKTSHHTMR